MADGDSSAESVDLVCYSKRLKSLVWKHFGVEKSSAGIVQKDKHVVCKLCSHKVAHGGGTTNLRNHLRTNHRTQYEELYIAEQDADTRQSLMDTFVRQAAVKKLPHDSKRAIELTDALLEFVARDLRPVSVVDGRGFLHLMEKAEPRYTVPCRRTVMNAMDRKYCELKRSVRGLLSGQRSVTVTTDIWTSRAGDGYFSLTAHYITDQFVMHSSQLHCHHMPGVHDHVHISEGITSALVEWCINLDDIVAFVTDNGSNIKKSVKEDLDKLHLPCAGHTLNLSVQKAFSVPEIQTAISRAKKVVEHFNRSRLHYEELEEKQQLLGLTKHKLIQGVQHRWNSVYDMIERLCEQQAAISAVLHHHRDLLHLEHSPSFFLEDLCKILEPFKDATTYLSARRYPTLSILGPVLHKILSTLEENDSSTSAAMLRVKNAIASDLRTRYQDVEVCKLLNKASLLDPRVKSLVHLTEEEQTNTVDDLVNEIVTAFSPLPQVVNDEVVLEDTEPLANSCETDQSQTSSNMNSCTGTNGEPVRKKCMLEKLLGDTFSNNNLESSVMASFNELVLAELSRYKAEPLLELKGKPLEWWRYHEHSYPKLSHVAKKYLGVVATSVPSEQLFSTAGNVVTAKRSALDPDNVEKLVFLHENLPPLEDLPYQRAKYKS